MSKDKFRQTGTCGESCRTIGEISDEIELFSRFKKSHELESEIKNNLKGLGYEIHDNM